MKKNYFKTFSKKHVWLYVVLIGLLLITTFFLVALFSNWFRCFEQLNEFGGWASYIAAVLTYIGSSLISVMVYYHTWVQQYKEEQLNYSIDFLLFCTNGIKQFADLENFEEEKRKYFYEYSQDELVEQKTYEYKEFIVRNHNKTYPLNVEILQVKLTIDTQQPVDCIGDIAVATNFDYRNGIDSKEKGSLLLGINKKLLNLWHAPDEYHNYNMEIIFKLTNSVGNKEFIRFSFVDNDREIEQKVLSKKEIKKILFTPYTIHQHFTF